MRATFRISLLWTSLLLISLAGLLACVVAWGVLLSTICSSPRTPAPQHVVSYNCHGMTVFLSPMQDALLHWLTPAGLLFMLLAAAAAAMVARTALVSSQGARGRIRITAVPPGEAPAWVREKWVGLELPLAQWLPRSTSAMTAGVLSGPRTFPAALAHLIRGGYQRRAGYQVNALDAITVLERASPEAADWWRVNAPHLMSPSRFFLFPEDCCAAVFREGD